MWNKRESWLSETMVVDIRSSEKNNKQQGIGKQQRQNVCHSEIFNAYMFRLCAWLVTCIKSSFFALMFKMLYIFILSANVSSGLWFLCMMLTCRWMDQTIPFVPMDFVILSMSIFRGPCIIINNSKVRT